MVINLRRKRRQLADKLGRTWWVGSYRRDIVCARRYRCFLNGEDVTSRTFYVDSRRGIVRRFKHNEKGQFYFDPKTNDAAWEELRGRVKLHRKAEAA